MTLIHTRHTFFRFFIFIFTGFLFSCATTQVEQAPAAEQEPEPVHKEKVFKDGSPIVTAKTSFQGKDTILLTFAGDIMAHTPNTARGHYEKIYEDIEPLLKESTLAFANLETPVDDSRPFSSYPAFNVNSSYPDAAINAGFTVFSLANNHTNDQSLGGIQATQQYFTQKESQTAGTGRPVYASGLKDGEESPYSYRIINQDSWKILFLAVTELLNQNTYTSYINYIKTSESERKKFIAYIKTLREENPCDVFVLSIHTAEPEYVRSVQKSQRTFYRNLLDAGVDVLWANHPHVAKEWEVITGEGNVPRKIIFYAMGNTISAQRTNPTFKVPATERDYTGDGYLTQLRFLRENGGKRIALVNPVLITTYITTDGLFVIRKLDDDFIAELKKQQRTGWATYLSERKKLMEKIEGKTVWQ